jgi:3-hydroxyisobutyrate dehydrogenase
MNDTQIPVAFIGLGLMGGHMAGHILAAGHPLHVYNRTRAKADGLVERGAIWHDDPGSAAAAADVVITIVGLPQDVEEVYLGAHGIITRARPGAILIDMTTSSPSLAKRIAAVARAKGLGAIDAPVSGGDIGARDESVAAGLDLKGLITALGQYTVLAERGGLRDGTQALIKVYD